MHEQRAEEAAQPPHGGVGGAAAASSPLRTSRQRVTYAPPAIATPSSTPGSSVQDRSRRHRAGFAHRGPIRVTAADAATPQCDVTDDCVERHLHPPDAGVASRAAPDNSRPKEPVMQIDIKGRNVPVTDEIRTHATRRLDKVARQVSELARLEIEIFKEPNPRVVRLPRRRGDAVPEGRDAARPRRLARDAALAQPDGRRAGAPGQAPPRQTAPPPRGARRRCSTARTAAEAAAAIGAAGVHTEPSRSELRARPARRASARRRSDRLAGSRPRAGQTTAASGWLDRTG